MKPIKLNNKGMSLMEVLAMTAALGFTVVATLTMHKVNMDMQKQNQMVNTAQQLQTRIRNLISDNSSFTLTLQKTSSAACLISNPPTACAAGTYNMNLWRQGDSAASFTSLTSATGTGAGFDQQGGNCATFDGTNGNFNCPFGYVITWTPKCPASGPCINPPIQVDATMSFNPGSALKTILNPAKYSVSITRSATAMNLSFKLVHTVSPNSAGGGVCNTGSYQSRNMSIPASGDPFSLVSAAGGGNISLAKTGTYRCTANAVGFAVDGFNIQLLLTVGGTSTVVGSAVGFAPKWVQGNATLETVFTVTSTPATLNMQQICTSLPGGTPNANSYSLGIPVSPYSTAPIYATLVCALID